MKNEQSEISLNVFDFWVDHSSCLGGDLIWFNQKVCHNIN